MKVIKYFITVLIIFSGCLVVAIFLDCKRIESSLDSRVKEIAAERQKLEQRYTESLLALPQESSDILKSALTRYKESKSEEERSTNFSALSHQVTQMLSGLPYNDATRRDIDELNGLLNRRERMGREYESALRASETSQKDICKYCGYRNYT